MLALILQQGLTVSFTGVAFGLIGAAAATRYLTKLLFGLSPLDPLTFVDVSAFFALIAALSC